MCCPSASGPEQISPSSSAMPMTCPSRSPLRSSRPMAVTTCRRVSGPRSASSAEELVDLAAYDGGFAQPQVATARGHRAEHLGRGEVEQPPQVLGGDEVPGRAQHVGADHGAGVDRLADRRVSRVDRCASPATSAPAARPGPGRPAGGGRRPSRSGYAVPTSPCVASRRSSAASRSTGHTLPRAGPPAAALVQVIVLMCARAAREGALPAWTLGCPCRGATRQAAVGLRSGPDRSGP